MRLGLLILRAAGLPEYDDPAAADTLRGWSCGGGADCSARWHRAMEEARSAKWPSRNLGLGLCFLAGWLGALMAWYRIGDLRRLVRMMTPGSKLAILGGGSAVWIGCQLAEWDSIYRDAMRGYYPSWGDTLTIPMLHLFTIGSLLPVPFAVGLAILWGARLPAPLWLWDRDRPGRSAAATGVCGLLALVAVDGLYWRVRDGSLLGVPLGLLALYLVLSARAAFVSRWTVAGAPARQESGDPG